MHNVVKTPAFGSQPGAGVNIHSRRGKKKFLPAVLAAATLAMAPVMSAVPAHAAPDPSLTVSPEQLDPEAENTVSVAGSNYSTDGPGVYVGVGPEGIFDIDDFHAKADLFDKVDFVNDIDDSGSFTRDISLSSPIIESDGEEINCLETQCGIYTIAAHGIPDRSQDAYQPIVFSGVDDNDGDNEAGDDQAGDDQDGEADDGGGQEGVDQDGSGDEGSDEDAGSDETGDTDGEGGADDNSDSDDEGVDDETSWEPELTAFEADGSTPLKDTEVGAGDTVIIRGDDWNPDGNVGGRGIPIPSDLSQGYYVVFGYFADDWQPSAGHSSDAREALEQRWALAEDVLNEVDERYQDTIKGQWVPLGDDGSFEWELELPEVDELERDDGNFGIYAYPAGGTDNDDNVDFEKQVLINYSADDSSEPNPDENPGSDDSKDDDPSGDDSADDSKTPKPKQCLAGESGSLNWGIYDGFRSYVEGNIAKGDITVKGAKKTNSGFNFPLDDAAYNYKKNTGTIDFSGAVTFTGHDGELNITFANPQIDISGSKGTLIVDVTDNTDGGKTSTVNFADLSLGSAPKKVSSASWSQVETTLTKSGSAAMQDFYDPGHTIDPASFTVNGSPTDCGSTTGPQKRNTTVAPILNIPGEGSNPSTAPGKTNDEPVKMCQTAGSASLTWGVKKSFTDYVTGPIADGSISPSGVSSGGSGFGWPGSAKDFDLEKGVGQVAFSGSVDFSGHDDALNLRIANPRIEVTSESAGVLYADVKSTNPAGEVTIDSSSVKIATLNLSGKKTGDDSSITYTAVPATLTPEGVPAFAEFYDAGSALDPVTFTVGAGAEVPCDELDSLPRTGSDLDLALAGGVFVALGALAVAGVRRRKSQVSAA